jgi:hypothetical protein
MENTWKDTFDPVNVAEEKDRFGNSVDNIEEEADNLKTETNSSFLSRFTTTPPEPAASPEPEVESDSFLSRFTTTPPSETPYVPAEESSFSSRFTTTPPSEEIETDVSDLGLVNSLLPEGIEAFSYKEADVYKDDRLYTVVEDYMMDRYGIQSVKGATKEEVVNKFFNNRRGNEIGNTIRGLSEADYLYNVSDSPKRLAKAGKAYALYMGSAGLLSDKTTASEKAGIAGDVIRELIFDPVNIVTLGVGKIVGGTAAKAAIKTVEVYAMKEVRKQLLTGVSKQVIKKNANKVYKVAVADAAKEGGQEVAEFAAKLAAGPGLKNIATKAGLREVGASTVVDAVVNSGTEFLYQKSLIDTGVQKELNTKAVGLAAIASLAVGGLSAGIVAKRGFSDTALVSEVVTEGNAKEAAKELQASINEYFKTLGKDMDDGTSWTSKTLKGKELNVADTDFFIDLLLGVSDKEGNTKLKGLAQVMQEQGFYYSKRVDVPDDNISNFISDFIAKMDTDDVKGIVKAFETSSGLKLKGMGDITPENFANTFANKMRQSAQSLNSASQVAKRLNTNVADLNVEQYLTDALGLNMLSSLSDKMTDKWFSGAISAGQNRFIRTLVSHPSTSFLNVLGYSASSVLGSVNDVTRGLLNLGVGELRSLVKASEEGASQARVGRALIAANANRVKLLLDPDMTAVAFKSALQRNTGALEALSKVQAGGVDVSNSVSKIADTTFLGRASEKYVDAANTATFVKHQDIFTKSQEYVFQMDKNLRVAFGKSWNDFYNSPDANKIMATKQYKALEETAVAKTLEHTFSKSYKGTTALGEIAGFIEDARNIPGLGLMVPFGRFFNNTVDFTVKNTPVLNQSIKLLGGKYPDKTHGELFTQGVIAGGLVYALAGNEQEKIKMGLGTYDSIDPLTGEVVSQQYDYPLSLFIATARLSSYTMAGKKPPEELITQIGRDFGGGGLTRNLSKTSGVIVDAVAALMAGELEKAGEYGAEVATDISSQLVAGFTRPWQPVDTLVGIIAGTEMSPKNVRDGNRFIGQSIRYIDNSYQVITGKPIAPVKVSSVEGKMDRQTTNNLGIRTEMYTDTSRLMNIVGNNSWEENASYKASKLTPEAANEYQRMYHSQFEKIAKTFVYNDVFLGLSLENQRSHVDTAAKEVRDMALARLSFEYTGAQSTLSTQLSIADKYTIADIEEGLKNLNLEGDLGDLTYGEITALESRLKLQDEIDAFNLPSIVQ